MDISFRAWLLEWEFANYIYPGDFVNDHPKYPNSKYSQKDKVNSNYPFRKPEKIFGIKSNDPINKQKKIALDS